MFLQYRNIRWQAFSSTCWEYVTFTMGPRSWSLSCQVDPLQPRPWLGQRSRQSLKYLVYCAFLPFGRCLFGQGEGRSRWYVNYQLGGIEFKTQRYHFSRCLKDDRWGTCEGTGMYDIEDKVKQHWFRDVGRTTRCSVTRTCSWWLFLEDIHP